MDQDKTTPDTLIDATAHLTIDWTEAPQLAHLTGKELPLGYAAALIEAEHVRELLERDGHGGYHKTSFTITYTLDDEAQTYRGRYDLGSDFPTLAEHIGGHIERNRQTLRRRHTEAELAEAERHAEHIARCIEAQRRGRTDYLA